MARKGKIRVVFDGNVVTVSGAADAEVEVRVVAPTPTIVGNTIHEPWWKRWSTEIVIGVIAALIVLAIGTFVHAS
jgi:hypothetical protein